VWYLVVLCVRHVFMLLSVAVELQLPE
jgi:hypothetical protein